MTKGLAFSILSFCFLFNMGSAFAAPQVTIKGNYVRVTGSSGNTGLVLIPASLRQAAKAAKKPVAPACAKQFKKAFQSAWAGYNKRISTCGTSKNCKAKAVARRNVELNAGLKKLFACK